MLSIARRAVALFTVLSTIPCVCTCFLPAQEHDDTDVASVVAQVQSNVAALRAKSPDFICKEEATVQETIDGKVAKTSQYVSTLVAVRKHDGQGGGFAESREAISATENGKPVKSRQGYFPPFGVRGGFAEDLFLLFDENRSK